MKATAQELPAVEAWSATREKLTERADAWKLYSARLKNALQRLKNDQYSSKKPSTIKGTNSL